MGLGNKGFENKSGVAFGFGIEGDAQGSREREEGKLPKHVGSPARGPSFLGPAPFKFYPDDVAALIDAEDVTVRRRASHYPVPHRYSA